MAYNDPMRDHDSIIDGHTAGYRNEVRDGLKKLIGLTAVADAILLVLVIVSILGLAKIHDDLDKVNRSLTQVGNIVSNNPGNPTAPTATPTPKEEPKK